MAKPAAPVGRPKTDPVAEDYRTRLVALRDRLEAALDDEPSARDLAALTARYESVLATLASLPAPVQEVDLDDELDSRRAARRAAAAGQ